MAASVLESTKMSMSWYLLAICNNMAQDPRVWSTPEVRKCIINIRMLLSTVSAESFIEQEEFHFSRCKYHAPCKKSINVAPAA
jgi:hypothetical protein